MTSATQSIEVWGSLACFTQPAFSVERFSYPAPTPSSVRGIFEAIYWKPEFRWRVTAIEVLKPIRYIALKRNEVKDRLPSADTILQWMAGRAEPTPLLADGDEDATGSKEKGRTQRQTLALRDVAYRLHARIVPWPGHEAKLAAMQGQFQRRSARGAYHAVPCFGCREFPAYFKPVEGERRPEEPVNEQIGLMLYDVFDLSRRGGDNDPAFVTLFDAEIKDNVITVPPFESDAVRKPTEGATLA